MGCISASRENRALKLVHPGGFVELHFGPVTAAEVMEKNPRHFVTRPDIFRFPWIVVRPESILNLGRVFYIVPYRTIYLLLQAYRLQNQASMLRKRCSFPEHCDPYQSCEQQSLAEHQVNEKMQHNTHDQHRRRESPVQSYAGVTPKHQDQQRLLEESPAESWIEVTHQDQPSLHEESGVGSWDEYTPTYKDRLKQTWVGSWAEATPTYQDRLRLHEESGVGSWDEYTPTYKDRLKQTWVGSWAEATPTYQDRLRLHEQTRIESWAEATLTYQDRLHLHEQTAIGSWAELTPTHQDPDPQNLEQHTPVSLEVPKIQGDEGLEFGCSDKVTKLKSCLRKQGDSSRSSRGLGVTFVLPGKDEKGQLKKSGLAAWFPGNSIC